MAAGPMDTAEHYDVVVVGHDLSAWTCGALLAHRKLRVRVMPWAGEPVDEPPEPLFGLRTAPIVQRVFDALGLVHAIRTRLEGEALPVTVALPDRRFTLEPETVARGVELGRAFPGDRSALLDLFGRIEGYGGGLDPLLDGNLELPADGLGARLAFRRVLAGLPAHRLVEQAPRWAETEPLRGLVAALLAVAGRPDEAAGPIRAAGARALWHLCHGIDRVRGGRAGLIEMIAEKLRAYGGTADPAPGPRGAGAASAVRAFEVRRRRVAAVVGADGRRYSAEVVIFTGDDAALGRLLGAAPAEGSTLAVGEARIALGPGDRPPRLRDPCGWVPAPGASGCLVRIDDDGAWLRWCGPAAPPPPLEGLVPFAGGDPTDAAARRLPGGDAIDPLGLFRVPVRGPLKNLARAGPWVVRGLGLEGDLLSAWQAAQVAERLAPRRRLVSRR